MNGDADAVVKKDTDQGEIVLSEKDADHDLVEEAYKKIFNTVNECVQMAIDDTGEYILKNFYGDSIEAARKNNPSKKESLSQLCKRFKDSGGATPSRSWIYQSVGLIVQGDDIKKYGDENAIQTYGKLSVSHKICLLSVKKVTHKVDLINEIELKKLSVRNLNVAKKELAQSNEEENSDTSPSKSILTILDNPDTLIDKSNAATLSVISLKKVSESKLKKIKEKAEKKQKDVEANIDELKKKINQHDQYLKKYEKVLSNVKKITGIDSNEEKNL